jgi:Flp pilus assembly protein TadG
MGSTDRKNKGQSLVEFMLVAPLLLILLVGIAEFGRAWMTQNILTGAAREAVRIYALDPAFGGGFGPANLRAEAILASANINGAISVPGDDGVSFGTVTWEVRYNFPLVVAGFVPGLDADIPLISSTSMRKEF